MVGYDYLKKKRSGHVFRLPTMDLHTVSIRVAPQRRTCDSHTTLQQSVLLDHKCSPADFPDDRSDPPPIVLSSLQLPHSGKLDTECNLL